MKSIRLKPCWNCDYALRNCAEVAFGLPLCDSVLWRYGQMKVQLHAAAAWLHVFFSFEYSAVSLRVVATETNPRDCGESLINEVNKRGSKAHLRSVHTYRWGASSVSVPSVRCAGCVWMVVFKIHETMFLWRTRQWYGTDTALIRNWHITDTELTRHWYGTDTALIRNWHVTDECDWVFIPKDSTLGCVRAKCWGE
jgi:hypothetical protein